MRSTWNKVAYGTCFLSCWRVLRRRTKMLRPRLVKFGGIHFAGNWLRPCRPFTWNLRLEPPGLLRKVGFDPARIVPLSRQKGVPDSGHLPPKGVIDHVAGIYDRYVVRIGRVNRGNYRSFIRVYAAEARSIARRPMSRR